MKNLGAMLLALIGGLNFVSAPAAEAQVCPEGCVVGGRTCVPLNLCKDGKPFLNGTCVDVDYKRFCNSRYGSDPGDEAGAGGQVVAGTGPEVVSEPVDVCESRFYDKGEEGFRRALLVGGDLSQLFREYISEAELKGVEIDLKELEVIFHSPDDGRVLLRWGKEVKLSLGELVRGYLPERAWDQVLEGRKAMVIDGAEGLAREYSADLYCGKR